MRSNDVTSTVSGNQNLEDREIEFQKVDARESGFTLIEVAVAMVIILVALLGVVFTFTYAIMYNMGNNSRSQALAVLQQEVEQMRAQKFTPYETDGAITGGVKADHDVVNVTGNHFTVHTEIDNDPSTTAIDDDTAVPNPTYKEIKITVTLASPSPGWQTAVPSTVVIRRTMGN
jgi:prepilin-type N-terminal cleavage/methylation domain-containing protein